MKKSCQNSFFAKYQNSILSKYRNSFPPKYRNSFRQNIGTFFRQNRQGSLQEFFRKLPERSFFETIFVKATLFSGGVMKMPPRPAKQFLS